MKKREHSEPIRVSCTKDNPWNPLKLIGVAEGEVVQVYVEHEEMREIRRRGRVRTMECKHCGAHVEEAQP